MRTPPRRPDARLFDAPVLVRGLWQGTGLLALLLAVYAGVRHVAGTDEVARASTFMVLVLSNLALIHANRSWRTASVRSGVATNKAFGWIALATLVLLGCVLGLPEVSRLFAFERPAPVLLLVGVGVAMLSLLWFEGVKWHLGRRGPLRTECSSRCFTPCAGAASAVASREHTDADRGPAASTRMPTSPSAAASSRSRPAVANEGAEVRCGLRFPRRLRCGCARHRWRALSTSERGQRCQSRFHEITEWPRHRCTVGLRTRSACSAFRIELQVRPCASASCPIHGGRRVGATRSRCAAHGHRSRSRPGR